MPAYIAVAMATVPPTQVGGLPAAVPVAPTTAAPVLAQDLEPAPPVTPPVPRPDIEQAPPATATPAEAKTERQPDQGGDIVVVGRDGRGDPLAGVNQDSYQATEAVDKAVFGPAALAYRKQIPRPLRSGIRNFVANLREPINAANFLLQHKVGKAVETVGRFAINTTLGVAGLFDAAKKKPFHLPRRRNSFANTLGFYGVKPGAYLFLPLIGSTTVRDLFGSLADQVLLPIGPFRPLRQPEVAIPLGILNALDFRAEFDDELEALRAQKRPYVAIREFYLQRRQAEIDALRGRRPYPPAKTKSLEMILDPDAAARVGESVEKIPAIDSSSSTAPPAVPPAEPDPITPVDPPMPGAAPSSAN